MLNGDAHTLRPIYLDKLSILRDPQFIEDNPQLSNDDYTHLKEVDIMHNPSLIGPQIEDDVEFYMKYWEDHALAKRATNTHRKASYATIKSINERLFANTGTASVVVRQALLSSGEERTHLKRCTLDTGANSGNYIGETAIEKFPHVKRTPCSHRARLGDGKAILLVDETITLKLNLYDDNGEPTGPVETTFYVVPSLGSEAIIGLPDILDYHCDYFVRILQAAQKSRGPGRIQRLMDICCELNGLYSTEECLDSHEEPVKTSTRRTRHLVDEVRHIASWYHNAKRRIQQDPASKAYVQQGNGLARAILCSPRFGTILLDDREIEDAIAFALSSDEECYFSNEERLLRDYPWGSILDPWSKPVEKCEEEDSTPDPLAFGEDILRFMETSVEESRAEYLELIQKHVSPEMKAAVPEIMELMQNSRTMECFAPSSWNGLKIEPVKLVTKGTLPDRLDVKARPIRRELYVHAENEFNRLAKYFYETNPTKNNSPICSPLVIAPKATAPFIRFCGDYRRVNEFIIIPQAPIPVVIHELTKAAKFKVYIDLDMANSFHQIPLSEEFSNLLSVKTPWGLVRPKFLPEGVGPASGLLQNIVREIFSSFEEWTVVIFDNFLILADNYQEAYEKLQLVLQRCAEYGFVLKMKKSFIGVDKVSFFGYEVTHGEWKMSQSRKDAIDALQFPKSKKEMQSFLGAALFFHHHIPDYSQWVARLYETTHSDFVFDPGDVWDPDKVDSSTEECQSSSEETPKGRTSRKPTPLRLSDYDYRSHFERFKTALKVAATLHFPDYSLPWVIRCDASEFAVGAVLFQIRTNTDGDLVHEPIAFSGKRFSNPATNWDAYKREAYAIYHSVHSFAWYLRGKQFVVESDHRNLQWIEASESPIVVRWRALLQSFNFVVVHIPGRDNKVADWISRQSAPDDTDLIRIDRPITRLSNHHSSVELSPAFGAIHTASPSLTDSSPQLSDGDPHLSIAPSKWWQPTLVTSITPQVSSQMVSYPTFEQIMKECHGDRQLHLGASRTYEKALARYPGAKISSRQVTDYVRECPMCQKTRETGIRRLPGITLSLKPDRYRRTIGMDHFTVSPSTDDGYVGCLLLVEHFSHFPVAYPVKSYDAETVARILFKHFCTYGMFDQLASDPGSAFTAEVITHLSSYLGFVHKISLVGRHESNGCEGSVKQYLRHLKTLVHDERLITRWADDTVLPLINFHLASFPTSETGGFTPFELKYGTDDAKHFHLPNTDHSSNTKRYHNLIQSLNEDIKSVRSASLKAQLQIAEDRRKSDGTVPQYMIGDLVLFDQLEHDGDFLPHKLAPRYLGPYEVLRQDKNDLEVKHIILRTIHTYHVTRFKPFFGTYQEALQLAKLDKNQVSIVSINHFTGNPFLRTSMTFNVTFDDGTIDRPYDLDLFETEPFEKFVESNPVLFPLRFSASQAKSEVSALRRKTITQFSKGDTVYLHMRFFDFAIFKWYDSIGFPDLVKPYFVPIRIGDWDNQRKTRVKAYVTTHSNKLIILDYFDIFAFVVPQVTPSSGHVLDIADKDRYPRAWVDLIQGPHKPLAIPR